MKLPRTSLSSLFEGSCIALIAWAIWFAEPKIQKLAGLILMIGFIVHIVRKFDQRIAALEKQLRNLGERLSSHQR